MLADFFSLKKPNPALGFGFFYGFFKGFFKFPFLFRFFIYWKFSFLFCFINIGSHLLFRTVHRRRTSVPWDVSSCGSSAGSSQSSLFHRPGKYIVIDYWQDIVKPIILRIPLHKKASRGPLFSLYHLIVASSYIYSISNNYVLHLLSIRTYRNF